MTKTEIIRSILEKRGLIPNQLIMEVLRSSGKRIDKNTATEIERGRNEYVERLQRELEELEDIMGYMGEKSRFVTFGLIHRRSLEVQDRLNEDHEKWIAEAADSHVPKAA